MTRNDENGFFLSIPRYFLLHLMLRARISASTYSSDGLIEKNRNETGREDSFCSFSIIASLGERKLN